MKFQKIDHLELVGTTDSGGDATVTATIAVYARLLAVEWTVGDLAAGVDAVLSVTNTSSGVDHTLLTLTNANSDAWYYTRVIASDNAGATITFDGTNEIYVKDVINGHLKLVISSGGDTKTGGVTVYYG